MDLQTINLPSNQRSLYTSQIRYISYDTEQPYSCHRDRLHATSKHRYRHL